MGGPGSGVQFHRHNEGWNLLFAARKRWFLYPPARMPMPHYPATELPIREWVSAYLPSAPAEARPLELEQACNTSQPPGISQTPPPPSAPHRPSCPLCRRQASCSTCPTAGTTPRSTSATRSRSLRSAPSARRTRRTSARPSIGCGTAPSGSGASPHGRRCSRSRPRTRRCDLPRPASDLPRSPRSAPISQAAYAKAIAHFEAADLPAAVRAMNASRRLSPYHAESWHNLGLYALALGQQRLQSGDRDLALRSAHLVKEAFDALIRAHKLLPAKLGTLQALSQAYTMFRQPEAAAALAPQIRELERRQQQARDADLFM